MQCQICGRFSSFYPLCNNHFRMKDQNLVNKCENCGLWFEGKKELCTLCSKGVKRGKDLIHVAKSVFEKWASSLYAIGKTGCKNYLNDFCLRARAFLPPNFFGSVLLESPLKSESS